MQSATAFGLPPLRLNPQVPRGAPLAASAIRTLEQAWEEVSASMRLPLPARLLTAERIKFLDLAAIEEIEQAERDPQGTLLYQIFRRAGVSVDYLDTIELPLVSRLPGVEVYWQPLAAEPVLYASRAYLDTGFCAANDAARLYSAIQFGENLIRVALDMLPELQPVPVQHRARVRECFRDSLAEEFDAIEHRFEESIDPRRLRAGFRLMSELLDSDEASYSMQGARLVLRFAGRKALVAEHELGRDFQAGIVSVLAEKVRARFLELTYRAFLRRFKPDEGHERAVRSLQWHANLLLRELDLNGFGTLLDAYAHSDIPLHYWAADSKRINPWCYPP